jgi:hypothetical protein
LERGREEDSKRKGGREEESAVPSVTDFTPNAGNSLRARIVEDITDRLLRGVRRDLS